MHAAGALAIAAGQAEALIPAAKAATGISVLAALPPDSAPPGVADYGEDELERWEIRHDAAVRYESVAWSTLHDKIRNAFREGWKSYDLLPLSGWAPEFAERLLPLDERLPRTLRADLPDSALKATGWNGHTLGVPSTLSLLTLYCNAEHLRTAGIAVPPTTWDELKTIAKELTRDGRYGWRLNYGTPAGIGGTASYWMTFLQQAGGTMYAEGGSPAFDGEPGVDALQLMVDLMPFTDPASLSDTSIVDTTIGLRGGGASMAMNWPFMWSALQRDPDSPTAGQFTTALLPAGPAGTASLDGSDAWGITGYSKVDELAAELIVFYLDPDVQKQQALRTGWLPIRTTLHSDEEIRAALPHASVVFAQATRPYDSFVTPDYQAVTTAIGIEVVNALTGIKSAAQAISDASDAVRAIVGQRTGG